MRGIFHFGLKGNGAPPSSSVTTTWKGATDLSNSSTKTTTFSSFGIGAADANRFVVVGIAYGTFATNPPTSVTIGGVAATITAQKNSVGKNTCIAYAKVPTGTTADIVLVTPDFQNWQSISVWTVISPTGLLVVKDAQTYSGTALSVSLLTDIDGSSFGIAQDGQSAVSNTFTGLGNDDNHSSPGSGTVSNTISSGHGSDDGTTRNITSSDTHSMIASFVSFRP